VAELKMIKIHLQYNPPDKIHFLLYTTAEMFGNGYTTLSHKQLCPDLLLLIFMLSRRDHAEKNSNLFLVEELFTLYQQSYRLQNNNFKGDFTSLLPKFSCLILLVCQITHTVLMLE
jgi:hypothetical protein